MLRQRGKLNLAAGAIGGKPVIIVEVIPRNARGGIADRDDAGEADHASV